MIEETPSLNLSLLDQLAKQDNVLIVSGSIPEKSGKDAYDWWMMIDELTDTLSEKKMLAEYYDINGGIIVSIEANASGYLGIVVLPDSQENDVLIVKEKIEQFAQDRNIKNLPIVIREEMPPVGYKDETKPENTPEILEEKNQTGWIVYLNRLINIFFN
ncbi:hypothetical protein [Methanimicrococcus hongohii]|uniref:hypothetical protein n=1 Tax=Methanimicrococcus hongohii TaxID=3028295 RepID=UPI00292FE974|nr:hypothetical protein [Methanimicrococcus sp. Hf6]